MRRIVKLGFLHLCRALGLFRLARHWTRNAVRILCYHGFAVGDQAAYAPVMYMRESTFRRRLRTIQRMGFPVLTLQDAVQQLGSGRVDNAPLVITVDDGWRSTLTQAAPLLREFGFPSTLYVTTYYSERPADVFNVVVRYMVWRTALAEVTLQAVHPALDGRYALGVSRDATANEWISRAEANLDWPQRQASLPLLANSLGLDYAGVSEAGRFANASISELRELVALGVDLQLHTHRHRMPDERTAFDREIFENQQRLEPLNALPCRQFCYPSGVYAPHHVAWLGQLGMESATTCNPGLNYAGDNPLLLRRHLDRDDDSDIEFESEIAGFAEMMRRVRQRALGTAY